jgi:hypothetical protein
MGNHRPYTEFGMPPLKAGDLERFWSGVNQKFPGFFDPPAMVPRSSSSRRSSNTLPTTAECRPVSIAISEEGAKSVGHLRLEFTFANLLPARQVAGGMEIVKAMARAFETAPGNAFSSSDDGKLVFLLEHENTTRICECTVRGPKIEKVDISDLEQSFTLDLSSKRKRSQSPFQQEWIEAKRHRTDGGENPAPGESAPTSAPAQAPSTGNLLMNEHAEITLPDAAASPARAPEKGKQAASISGDGLPNEGTTTPQPPPQPIASNTVMCFADCTNAKYAGLAKTYKREMELQHYGYAVTAAGLKTVSGLCDAVPAVPLGNGRYVHYNVPLGVTGRQLATVVRRIEGNNELKDLRIVVSSATPGAYISPLDLILDEMDTSKKQSGVRGRRKTEAKNSLGGNGTG